jgi:hypothetical protein
VPALVEVVTQIDAVPEVVFHLELDMDVHSASLADPSARFATNTSSTISETAGRR